jgi:hypothetical protein
VEKKLFIRIDLLAPIRRPKSPPFPVTSKNCITQQSAYNQVTALLLNMSS